MLKFLDFTHELQIKYNGGADRVNIINDSIFNFTIYKFLGPPSKSFGSNVTVLDIGRSVTAKELTYLSNINGIHRKNLYFFSQNYGLDIFNLYPKKRSNDDFVETCIAMASALSYKTSLDVSILFCDNKLYDNGTLPQIDSNESEEIL